MADSPPKPAPVAPPPDKGKKESKAKTKSDKPRGRPPELQKQLEDMFMMVGLMTSGAINEFDGEVIRDNAESLAESWNKVAQQNATVKRILNQMMETGAWSGALTATAAVAIPILQNHGAIPASIPHPFAKPPHLQSPQQQPVQHPPMANQPPVPNAVPQAPGQSPIQQSRSHTPPEPPPMPPGQHS